MLLHPEVFALNSAKGVRNGRVEGGTGETVHSTMQCTPIRQLRHDRLDKGGTWGIGRAVS